MTDHLLGRIVLGPRGRYCMICYMLVFRNRYSLLEDLMEENEQGRPDTLPRNNARDEVMMVRHATQELLTSHIRQLFGA